MPRDRYYRADVQDPVTGQTSVLTADTEAELEHRINELLSRTYPHPEPDDGS